MSTDPARSTLTASDGVQLTLYRWQVDAPVGVLVIVHGYAEHARRHATLARGAQDLSFDVFGLDWRGHGESPGVRGSVRGFGPAIADLHELIRNVRATDPRIPVLLFGHSMGGAIALRYALEHPNDLVGLALSSPFLKDAARRPALLNRLAGVIAAVAPELPVAALDAGLISRVPAEVARYRDDPLVYHGGVRAAAGHTMLTQGAALLARASGLSVPTLVIVGSADGIADPAGARELAAASSEVRLEVLEGGYHELHHDDPATGTPQRFQGLLSEWLQASTRSTMNLR